MNLTYSFFDDNGDLHLNCKVKCNKPLTPEDVQNIANYAQTELTDYIANKLPKIIEQEILYGRKNKDETTK